MLNSDNLLSADLFDGTSVLITGGLGFLGSNLARRLVQMGARVFLVDNMLPGGGASRFNIAGIQDRVEVRVSDARDSQAMACMIRGNASCTTLRATPVT